MNMVAIIGNVAAEPELRHSPAGKSLCRFRVAVSRPGESEADFFTVVAHDRQAEVCAEYLHVGRRISIEGRLHHAAVRLKESDSHEFNREVEIVAHRVSLLSRGVPSDEVMA